MTYTMTEKENSAETHQRCDRAVPLKRKPGIDKMTKPALDTTDRLIQAKKTTATLYGTYAVIYPH
jgi:hypothetical protein